MRCCDLVSSGFKFTGNIRSQRFTLQSFLIFVLRFLYICVSM